MRCIISAILEYLRSFHFGSVLLRLLLAVTAGGIIGYGRARKRRNAGLRTYMFVSLGAALTMLISLYEYDMLETKWLGLWDAADVKFDGTRYAAQVISGIGFLAGGTIIGTAHQQVSGLTTAIGLVASAALGIAAGAGFYEIVIVGMVLIIFSMEMLSPAEIAFKRKLHNITIYVEFDSIENVSTISTTLQNLEATIYDIDIERSERLDDQMPSAIFALKLGKEQSSHSALISSVAELDCVRAVRELIS